MSSYSHIQQVVHCQLQNAGLSSMAVCIRLETCNPDQHVEVNEGFREPNICKIALLKTSETDVV
jgi:hypothetical protein